MKFGRIRLYAWRLLRGWPIPLFRDNRVNVAIEDHLERILKARTRRPRR